LHAIEPEYPDDANDRERYIVLRVFISERGTVDDVAVQAAGAADAFENSARAAFARARFAPGILRGVPVKSQLLVEVKFDPGTASPRNGEIAATVTERAD
jgi:TonB family protein